MSWVGPQLQHTVYWVGRDGNVYYKSGSQVQNMGKALGTSAIGFDAERGSFESRQIDDPVASSDGLTPVGGGGGALFTDTSGARSATQKSIDALDTVEGNNLRAIADNFNRILSQYNDEETINKKNYDTQVQQNEENKSRNLQASLLGAAQGGRGLRAVLASLNALGGTGELLANRAVASEANRDIGEGNRTFDNNATTLVNAYSATQQDERNRRAEAEAARANEERAARAEVAKQKQSLYEKMAGLWGQAGNNAKASRYLGLVGELAPRVAEGSATSVAPYTPRSATFSPGQLSSYLGGANDMTVKTGSATSPSILNSPLYSLPRKREELV